MEKLQKFLSIFMCAVLCIGTVIPAFAVSAAAAPQKGGDPLAGIAASGYNVWRYESAETLSGASAAINAYVTKDGTRTTEMKYTVDPNYGVKCAATVYEPVGGELGLGDHRITTAFVGANKLIVDCNYIAVTYLTESTAKNGLVFRNTGGAGSVTLTSDTSVSGGKWVTVYAPITDANKTNIITRMNKSFGNMALVWAGANGANDALYVREIVFFNNITDTKAYAAAAPVCYNGDAYVAPKDEPIVEKKEDTTVDVSAARGEVVQDGNKIIYDSYDPFTVLNPETYNIWSFESADTLANASATINAYADKNGNRTTEMKYTVEPNTGVKCAVTVYEPVGGQLGLGNQRITAAFVGANKLKIDCNYVAVTYLTGSNEKYGLVFRNTGGAGDVKLTEDTSDSNSKWVTVYAPITDVNKTNIITRMNKSYGNMGLVWDGAKDEKKPLYVREIVFFENEADVAIYAEVAAAYYNGEKVVKRLPKTEEQKLKLNLMAGVIAAMRGARWAEEAAKRTTLPTEWIEYAALFDMRSAAALDKTSAIASANGVVTYNTEKNSEAAKLEFTPGTSTYGYYRIAFTPDAVAEIDTESGNYYAAVTYRANVEAALTLKAGNDALTIAEKTAVSEKWQSVCVKIDANSDILKALADGNDTVALCWGQNAPNGIIEIKELVIFANSYRADEYEEYAPGYYNDFVDWMPKNPLDVIDNEILISFSSVYELQKMLLLRDTTDTNYCSELVEVDKDGISAIKLSGGAASVSSYRRFQFVTQPTAKVALMQQTSGDVYAAITVMTDGVGDLYFRANNGTGGAIAFGATAVSDKWQTLVCETAVAEALLNLLKTDYNSKIAIEWQNADQTKNIIIKEVVFFDNKADAVKYGESAAEYYNYKAGYEKIDAPDNLGAPEAPLSGITKYDKWTYATADTLTADGASINNMSADTVYTKDPNFAVRSLRLKYNSSLSTYRYNTAFNSGNKLMVTPKYMAVTYLTRDQAQASITFNTYTAGGSGTIAADTSMSNGKWRTDYIALTDTQSSAIATRMSGAFKNFAIDWTNTATNSEIYIREAVFFENEADAVAYTSKAPAYYNYSEDYSWNVDPITLDFEGDKIIWSYTSANIGANGAQIKSGASIVVDPITGVTSAKVTAANFECRYNAANRFTIANPNYVAVTYMTPDEAQYSLFWAYINGSHTQSENLSGSKGRWVTEYVKLTDAQMAGLKTRLNKTPGGNHVIIQALDGGTAIIPANLYIRDIIFFENENDVKAYAKQAQIYYNYYSK